MVGDDGVLHLVGRVVDLLLDRSHGLVDLALVLQALVVGQVACSFFDAALCLVDVRLHRWINSSDWVPSPVYPDAVADNGGGPTACCRHPRTRSRSSGRRGSSSCWRSSSPSSR